MVPDAVPFGRAGLRPLPDHHARTSDEASGAAVSSGVALTKHGGLSGRTGSTGPRSAAAPSRARPNHRCRRTESDRPRALGVSGRRRRDPRDERRGHMRRWLDAPGNTSGWSPAGDSRGSLEPELPGRGRACAGYRIRTEPHGPASASRPSGARALHGSSFHPNSIRKEDAEPLSLELARLRLYTLLGTSYAASQIGAYRASVAPPLR